MFCNPVKLPLHPSLPVPHSHPLLLHVCGVQHELAVVNPSPQHTPLAENPPAKKLVSAGVPSLLTEQL